MAWLVAFPTHFERLMMGTPPRGPLICLAVLCIGALGHARAQDPRVPIGTQGQIGCAGNARRVQRLTISEPGVYENILVDGEWTDGTLLKINADNVTLRHCEIRHGKHNAVTIYARNVLIESCRIHHVLAGTFADQQDAHGITGRPTNLTVRNCDIGKVSGDAIQFDPGRGPWGEVLIENCRLWTAPLEHDAAGFKKGERPGENGVDTKQSADNPRSRMTIRDCVLTGWDQPGQISNMAALNLKNHVDVEVERCLFRDNEICFRVRGGTDQFGGASVSINDCYLYDAAVGIRAENDIARLKIGRIAMAKDVRRKFVSVGGEKRVHELQEFVPPPLEELVEQGVLGSTNE